MDARGVLEPESVDLLLTSPPYLKNYHYVRNTRPQMYWLGFASSPRDLRGLEETNFGRFWQTVRDREPVRLDFRSPARAARYVVDPPSTPQLRPRSQAPVVGKGV